MKLKFKLRGKLLTLSLLAGLLPLLFAIIYLGNRSVAVLEDQAHDYLKSKVDGFARMADVRYGAISGNLDIIKEQLTKSLKADLVKEAGKEKYYESGYMFIMDAEGQNIYHPSA